MLQLRFSMTTTEFIFLFLGIILGAVVVYFIIQFFIRKNRSSKETEPSEAEIEAESLLQKRGFKIKNRGLQAPILTNVDGKTYSSISSVDFLVEKDNKNFIVRIHGGSISADPTDPALIRKFIESEVVYQPDGLLLLDLVDKSIQEISFTYPKSRASLFEGVFRIIQILFVLGVILGIIWLMVYLKLF